MAGRVVVVRLNDCIFASGNASGVNHEQQHKSGDAVPKAVGGHGWNVLDNAKMPPHAAVVNTA